MQITEEQMKLLQEMAGQLDRLGITLGVLTPHAAFMPEGTEFVIRFPVGEFDVPMLLHKNDINFRREGNVLIHEPVNEPKHDDEAQTVIDAVNEAILDGSITFDPLVKRKAEGFGEFEITRRDLTQHPRIGCYLYELPLATQKGNLWTYERIVQLANEVGDPRFKLMKEIIDEEWPDEAEIYFRSQVAEAVDRGDYDDPAEEEPAVKPTQLYMPSKLMRSFKKWLMGD